MRGCIVLSLLMTFPSQTPAKVRTLDIEGQIVRCIETDDGKRTWLCECADFQERAARWANNDLAPPVTPCLEPPPWPISWMTRNRRPCRRYLPSSFTNQPLVCAFRVRDADPPTFAHRYEAPEPSGHGDGEHSEPVRNSG